MIFNVDGFSVKRHAVLEHQFVHAVLVLEGEHHAASPVAERETSSFTGVRVSTLHYGEVFLRSLLPAIHSSLSAPLLQKVGNVILLRMPHRIVHNESYDLVWSSVKRPTLRGSLCVGPFVQIKCEDVAIFLQDEVQKSVVDIDAFGVGKVTFGGQFALHFI